MNTQKHVMAIGNSDDRDEICPKCDSRFVWMVTGSGPEMDEVYRCPVCGMDKHQAKEMRQLQAYYAAMGIEA